MQKITPHLWFDQEAIQAVEFYTSTLLNSKIKYTTVLHDTPSGSVDVVTFELLGLEIQAISAGPMFKFNPSVTFHVLCKTKDEVSALSEKLADDGQVLMELGEYPFNEWFSWVQDRYGLSWQLLYSGEESVNQRIRPAFMFVGKVCGKAEEAINFWTSVFHDAKVNRIQRYGPDEEQDREGTVKNASFSLFGQDFIVMDSAYPHAFSFNEAISLIVNCDSQEEIDYYWDKLSAVPEAEQCGWLKDKYGLSWQVVPSSMEKLMGGNDRVKVDRVTQAFLGMKKIDFAKLQEAYDGK